MSEAELLAMLKAIDAEKIKKAGDQESNQTGAQTQNTNVVSESSQVCCPTT